MCKVYISILFGVLRVDGNRRTRTLNCGGQDPSHQHSSNCAPRTRSRCVAVRGGGASLGFTDERFLVRSPSRCCAATPAPSERCAANNADAWACAATAGAWWPDSLLDVEGDNAAALPRDFERERGGDGTLAWRLLIAVAADCDEGTASAARDVDELG